MEQLTIFDVMDETKNKLYGVASGKCGFTTLRKFSPIKQPISKNRLFS
ncbi:hypothetical protein [Bacillus toyonensis]|nr:hypothetical protein [Bacillus toyonensis]